MELLKSIGHPDEISALVRFKLGKSSVVKPQCSLVSIGTGITIFNKAIDDVYQSVLASCSILNSHIICLERNACNNEKML